MCGVVGIVGQKEVTERLVAGLKRLEYRGYDSSGVATLVEGQIQRRRSPGKLGNLETLLKTEPLTGKTGIGHIRWATHGAANETNAHPHTNENVAVVHNGIIENYATLKTDLQEKGHVFKTDTDTEVIVHLITDEMNKGLSPIEAVKAILPRLEGAYALGIIFADQPHLLIGARRGSPLAIGYGNGEMYLGSDGLALAHLSDKISFLQEGDMVVLTQDQVTFYDKEGHPVTREIKKNSMTHETLSKEPYKHFMLKEIFEHPEAVQRTLRAYLQNQSLTLPALPFDWKEVPKITLVACGTAYYAAFVAKYWFERLARISVEVDIASEFRYRTPPMTPKGLSIFISQSGETADTLAAFKYAQDQGQHTLAVVNVPESSLAREVETALYTYAGVEIGVASTKAFSTQLTVLALLALDCALKRGTLSPEDFKAALHSLIEAPTLMSQALTKEPDIQKLAQSLLHARDILYLGRGTHYGMALEGALKMKEITYIHAEGYAAGEMKHGPIALLEPGLPIIAINPFEDLFDKTVSNIEEALARGAAITVLTDAEGAKRMPQAALQKIVFPKTTFMNAPLVYAVPLHLLSYHTATLKGTDVDQPRNLAKSVTVE